MKFFKNLRKPVAVALSAVMTLGFGVSVNADVAITPISAVLPSYMVDFSGTPEDMFAGDGRLNVAFELDDERGWTATVLPGASQQGLSWEVVGGNVRTGGSDEGGFMDPNGANRRLQTTVELSGPITVELVGGSHTNNPATDARGAIARIYYGDDVVEVELAASIAEMVAVSHTFESGSGIVSVWLPWDGGDRDDVGRIALRSVAIFEGGEEAQPPAGGGDVVVLDDVVGGLLWADTFAYNRANNVPFLNTQNFVVGEGPEGPSLDRGGNILSYVVADGRTAMQMERLGEGNSEMQIRVLGDDRYVTQDREIYVDFEVWTNQVASNVQFFIAGAAGNGQILMFQDTGDYWRVEVVTGAASDSPRAWVQVTGGDTGIAHERNTWKQFRVWIDTATGASRVYVNGQATDAVSAQSWSRNQDNVGGMVDFFIVRGISANDAAVGNVLRLANIRIYDANYSAEVEAPVVTPPVITTPDVTPGITPDPQGTPFSWEMFLPEANARPFAW